MPIHVRVLGPVAVTGPDGSPVHIGGPRAVAVLAALALAGPEGASTQWLVDAVWGGGEPASATRTVQAYLARLRSGLPGLIVSRRQGYALAADAVVDARLAHDCLDAARAVQGHDPVEAEQHLREGAALWRGGVAEGASLDGALDAIRELEQLRRDTLAALVAVAGRLGRGDVLVDAARELLRLDPFHEGAAAALARHLAGSGQQAHALAVLRDVRRTLADNLGVEPSAVLREAEIAVLRQEVGLPAAARQSAAGDRLPTSLSSFIGREADLQTVAEALRRSRVVTVVATGGAGKSRLALEVARRWRESGRSVLHVGLAGVPPGGTVAAVRRAADLGAGTDGVDDVAAALPGTAPLLVLDNAEELLDEVADTVERLAARQPDLRLLITSRSALMLPGERVHQLGPLSMTGADGGDAARLLVERAEQIRPGVTARGLPTLIEVSRELDGLPLALELAAARLREVSVAQLRDELADQLHRARLRGGLTRHRSLQAVMASSVDGLDDLARAAHGQLAVLRSWWTEDIAADLLEDALPRTGVGIALDSLVAASLLVVDVEGPTRRLRAYEPVRQDALRRLRECGEEELAQRRHLTAHLRLLRRAGPRLSGPEETVWLDTVDRSREDIAAALDFAHREGQAAALVELVTSCSRMWSLRWSPSFAVPWLRAALQVAGEPADAATISADLASLLRRQGSYAEAEKLADEAVAIARRGDRLDVLGHTLHSRGLVDKDRLRYAEARPLFEEAVARRRAAGNLAGAAMSRGSIADMDAARGDFEAAEQAYAEGLRLMREAGSPSGELAYLHSMAELQVGRADAAAAARYLADAIPLATSTGDRQHAGLLQLVIAWLDRVRPQPWEVRAASAREALRLTVFGDVRAILDAVEHAAGVLLDRGRVGEAGRLLAAAAQHRDRLSARRSATREPLVAADTLRAAGTLRAAATLAENRAAGPGAAEVGAAEPSAAEAGAGTFQDLASLVAAATEALAPEVGG